MSTNALETKEIQIKRFNCANSIALTQFLPAEKP